MQSPLVDIRDLSFRVGRRTVLDRVSFEVDPGQHVMVIGPNGAGKTTLLRCLMRIYSEASGVIRVAGRDLKSYTQKHLARMMSYVPQDFGPALECTTSEFVAMGRYPHLGSFARLGKTDRAAIARALELTHTAALADQPLRTLSGGERQRVLIAAGLAQGASILLADEPTAFLDPLHQANVQKLLETVNRTLGLTILSVTHDINSAALWADRVVALKAGRVAFCGAGAELMTNRVLGEIFDKRFEFTGHPVSGNRVVVPDERSR